MYLLRISLRHGICPDYTRDTPWALSQVVLVFALCFCHTFLNRLLVCATQRARTTPRSALDLFGILQLRGWMLLDCEAWNGFLDAKSQHLEYQEDIRLRSKTLILEILPELVL